MVSNGTLAWECEKLFMEVYCYEECPVIEIIRYVEESCGLSEGTSIALFKQLVRSKSIKLDLNKKINLTGQRHEVYNGTQYFYGVSLKMCW